MMNIAQPLRIFTVILLFASLGPTAANTSARTEPIPDEVDDVVRSAKAAIEIIKKNLTAKNREWLSVSNRLKVSLDEQKLSDEIAQQLRSKLDQISEILQALSKELDAVRVDIAKLSEELKELKRQKELLSELIRQKAQAIAGIEKAAADAAQAAIEAAEAARAKPFLIAISRDRIEAAKLVEFIQNNQRVALSEMLKRESPGSNVDVREVKDVNGLLAIFRIGGLTHCLSTKLLCDGKTYSLTR